MAFALLEGFSGGSKKEGIMGNKDTASGFGIGFALGAVIGITMGLLYAPKPGKETREILRDKASTVASKVKQAAIQVKTKAAQRIEAAKG